MNPNIVSRLMPLAYRAQRLLWKLFRPRTRGVKVMLFNAEGQILLIRNTYGASELFVLPGGGVRPWETPLRAAHREVGEELGCTIEAVVPVSTHFTNSEGKRDTVYVFEARIVGIPRADSVEVVEARFFDLAALPEKLSPATARRLAERSGKVEAECVW